MHHRTRKKSKIGNFWACKRKRKKTRTGGKMNRQVKLTCAQGRMKTEKWDRRKKDRKRKEEYR